MEIFVLRNGGSSVEEGFSRLELPALIADETNVVWVDLRGESEEELAITKDVLCNVFKFHYLTIEDCLETRNQPKIEGFPDYLYFIVHGVKPDETTSTNFVTKEKLKMIGELLFHVLVVTCINNFVISYRYRQNRYNRTR